MPRNVHTEHSPKSYIPLFEGTRDLSRRTNGAILSRLHSRTSVIAPIKIDRANYEPRQLRVARARRLIRLMQIITFVPIRKGEFPNYAARFPPRGACHQVRGILVVADFSARCSAPCHLNDPLRYVGFAAATFGGIPRRFIHLRVMYLHFWRLSQNMRMFMSSVVRGE